MLRTDTVLLRPTPGQELELFRLALHTSKLWDEANYQRRQAYLNRQRIPKYSDQCKALKNSENFKAIGTGRDRPH